MSSRDILAPDIKRAFNEGVDQGIAHKTGNVLILGQPVSKKVVMSYSGDMPCPKLGKVKVRWRKKGEPTAEWENIDFLISPTLVHVFEHLPINSLEIEVYVPAKADYEKWIDSPIRSWLKRLWRCRKSGR